MLKPAAPDIAALKLADDRLRWLSAWTIHHAEEIVAAFEAHPDAGVLSVGGKMVDRPHLVQARRVLERAR